MVLHLGLNPFPKLDGFQKRLARRKWENRRYCNPIESRRLCRLRRLPGFNSEVFVEHNWVAFRLNLIERSWSVTAARIQESDVDDEL